MARLVLLAILTALTAFAMAGCQTPPPESDASRRGVSTIPWNRPAKWEGGGPLGSQMGAMRGY
ncbi:MAG: hypothetical protein IAE97_07175 [Chthoniobacterales bacterium]|nr:hypothetical protein [Chthoniobacterales bacterium]